MWTTASSWPPGSPARVVAVLCCLAPLLLTLLGIAGISAVLGDLEYALIPVAILLIGIPIYAVLKQRKRE